MEAEEQPEKELSPLEQAAANSLEELFSTDPEEMTEDDVEKIVATLRARRELFRKEEEEAKSKKRAVKPGNIVPKPKAPAKAKKPRKADELLAGLDLDSLELDLKI